MEEPGFVCILTPEPMLVTTLLCSSPMKKALLASTFTTVWKFAKLPASLFKIPVVRKEEVTDHFLAITWGRLIEETRGQEYSGKRGSLSA